MKYKLTVLFCLFIGICSFNFVHAKGEDISLLGKTIYIDPGHPEYSYTQDNEK